MGSCVVLVRYRRKKRAILETANYLDPLVDRHRPVQAGAPSKPFRDTPPRPLNGVLQILCIGNFIEKKGIDTLIDACSLLRDQGIPFHVHVYGDVTIAQVTYTQNQTCLG